MYYQMICTFILTIFVTFSAIAEEPSIFLASADSENQKVISKKASGNSARLQRQYDSLDKLVSKVERTLSKGNNPSSQLRRLENTLNIAKENYPNEDFSVYEQKLVNLKTQAEKPQAAKKNSSSGEGDSQSTGLTGRELRKYNSAIKKIERAIEKVEDSIALGKKADNRIRNLEKSIEDAKKKFPNQNYARYEQKLAVYRAGSNKAAQEEAFAKFDREFSIKISRSKSGAKSAQSLLNAMRVNYPNADYSQYEAQITALTQAGSQAEQARYLAETVLHTLEQAENKVAKDDFRYLDDVLASAESGIIKFKQRYPEADTSAHEQKIEKFRKLLTENAAAIAAAAREKKPDQGITSSIHEKYVGKIVFSNKPIPLGAENEANFISKYQLGDDLYFRVYLAQSAQNTYITHTKARTSDTSATLLGKGEMFMAAKTPNKKYGSCKVNHAGVFHYKNTKTTWGGQLFNSKDMSQQRVMYDEDVDLEFRNNIYRVFLRQVLGYMPAEDTQMQMETVFKLSEPQDPKKETIVLASGSLGLDVSSSSLKKVTTMKGMCLDKAFSNDSSIEKQALKAARHIKDDLVFSDEVVLRDKGWTMVRHAITGVLTERRIVSQFIVQKPNDICYSYETVMAQQHLGNDKWDDFYIMEGMYGGMAFNSTWKQVSCGCLD